jgi:hypothetical protein
MSAILRLILAVLATYRLTRMIVNESGPGDVLLKLRSVVISKPGYAWCFIADLINCEYCVSVWVAAVLAVLVLAGGWFGTWVLVWLGLSGAFYIAQEIKDRME